MKKLIKFFLFSLLFLLLLVIAGGYYFLNTNSGLKQAIALANRYSGYQISAEKIQGKLWQKTELHGVKMSGKGLDITSGFVQLAWQPQQLWDYRVVINAIQLDDTVIRVAKNQETEQQPTQPLALSDIKLPIDIKIEALELTNLTINQPTSDKPIVVVDHFQLGVDYIQQRGEIHTLRLRGEGVDLNMQGHIVTQGDYPLSLSNVTQYTSTAYGSQIVEASIVGELKKQLAINLKGQGLSDFSLLGTLESLLDNPHFQANFSLQQFDAQQLNLPDTAAHAELSVVGDYQSDTAVLTLHSQGKINYHSPQTDSISLTFVADVDEQALTLSDMTIDLLTAQQQLQGKGRYGLAAETLDFSFHSEALSWPQNEPNSAVLVKDLVATVSGKLADYQVALTTTTHTAAIGEMPITVTANGNTQALEQLHAKALINQQPLELSGKLAWQPALDYQGQIAAKNIEAFQDFPGLKEVLITASGDEKSYQASGGGQIFSDIIAPSDFTIKIDGTLENLQQAQLQIDTLGGKITAQASGDLLPLDVAADLRVANIHPQQFYTGVQANINAQLTAQLSQTAGNLLAAAEIKQLTGSFQKMPLSGSGKVVYDQAKQVLNVQALALDLAGNRIDANGILAADPSQGQSDLSANIDAQQLEKLLPQLGGALQGRVIAKGSLQQPELVATLKGTQLKYQQNKITQLAADMDISLAKDSMNVMLDTKGITAANNAIEAAKIAIKGKLASHTLNMNVRSAEQTTIPTVVLVGQGGLDKEHLIWKGTLRQLSIDSGMVGQWRMPAASDLILSADKVMIKSLCLRQQGASLCGDGQMQQQNGQFTVKLKQLSTQAFAQLIPDTVKVNAVLNGEANIDMIGGKPSVQGKVLAHGGTLQFVTGSGGLNTDIQQFESHFALKNNRAEATLKSQFSKLGKIQLAAVVPDIHQQNLRANIKIDSNDLHFLEELVPQLSDVNGRLNGDMTLSGNPAQRLNVAGKVTLQKTRFNVPQFATEISDLTLDIFAKNGNQLGFKGGAKASKGQFIIDGNLNPISQKGQINIKGNDFQIANSRKLQVAISPDLQVVFSDNIKIRGEIIVPRALIVPESSGSKITASEDVVLPQSKAKKKTANSPIDAEINVKLGNDVRVASADVETRLSGAIKVIAKPGKVPAASGNIAVQTGELRIYGQLLNIERGRIIFNGPLTNPALDIRTSREVDEVTVGATLLGTVTHPQISLFSTPSMSDSAILSYLLFGRPPDSESFSSMALLQTGGLVGANTLARNIRSSVGLDVLNFTLTGMEAGKNLSRKFYVGMKSDFFTAVNEFLLKYKVSSSLHVDGAFSGDAVSVDLIKVIETD